jgi:hypothetical protein
VVVDPISLGFVRGSEIDFVDELIGAQFKINIRMSPPLAAAALASRSSPLGLSFPRKRESSTPAIHLTVSTGVTGLPGQAGQ